MIVVIIFMIFFVRFLVFELLSILYFTVVNSDLGLEQNLAGKQRSVALRNIPLTLISSDKGINRKACAAWGQSPRGEVQVGKTPRLKIGIHFFFKFLLRPAKKIQDRSYLKN